MPRAKLQKREKIAVAAVAALAIVLLFQFAARPPLKGYQNAKRAAAVARSNVSIARQQRDEIVAERNAAEAIREVIGQHQGDLASVVNRQLTQAGMKQDGRGNWRVLPRASEDSQFLQVSITLNGVTLKEIVDLLHGLYASNNAIVTQRMVIEPNTIGQGLKADILLLAPQV